MARHRVRPGDCVTSLAKANGLITDRIWSHAANAGLKSERSDPNVLLPGDEIEVPDKETKTLGRGTDSRHRFKRKQVPAKLRLRLLHNGKPRADAAYSLDVDGTLLEGRTDGDGRLEHRIPPDAREGTLTLKATGEVYPLNLGKLDPVEDDTGLQQRLANLGLYRHAVDGRVGPKTRAALALFQAREGLEATGEPDDATREALRKAHES